MKMIQKWNQKWDEDGPKMATVNNTNSNLNPYLMYDA